ncbi:MAG: voltage-gated potassium channel [Mariniblastus sp.]|jgi:voltage-gated potassium channel
MSNKHNGHQSFRDKVHEIIFGAHTAPGIAFDVCVLLAIVLSVISNSLETVEGYGETWRHNLSLARWGFTGLFTLEYIFRIYCVRKPLRFVFSFWGIVDLLAIVPDFLLLYLGGGPKGFSAIRALRLLRVFRILNLSWFQQEGEELGNAIWRSRGKITVFILVVMIIVTVSGTIMYDIENAWDNVSNPTFFDNPVYVADPDLAHAANVFETIPGSEKFTSIPMGIYWAIVTMTTVGFGDIVPKTPGGQLVSAFLILVGYSLIIVPTGFVSAEVLGAKRMKVISTIACASCLTENHDEDAIYCKYCGDEI